MGIPQFAYGAREGYHMGDKAYSKAAPRIRCAHNEMVARMLFRKENEV